MLGAMVHEITVFLAHSEVLFKGKKVESKYILSCFMTFPTPALLSAWSCISFAFCIDLATAIFMVII